MAGTHWIVEGKIDPRWPINTRGNIGEVFPGQLAVLLQRVVALRRRRAGVTPIARLAFSGKAISRAPTP